jgi:hypothetical protein
MTETKQTHTDALVLAWANEIANQQPPPAAARFAATQPPTAESVLAGWLKSFDEAAIDGSYDYYELVVDLFWHHVVRSNVTPRKELLRALMSYFSEHIASDQTADLR